MTPTRWLVYTHHNVEKEIRRLPKSVIQRVVSVLEALEEDPRPAGSAKLQEHDLWKLRVGSYRIIYEIDDERHTVTVYRIRHRRDVYRNL